jgi:hypothetical protein
MRLLPASGVRSLLALLAGTVVRPGHTDHHDP